MLWMDKMYDDATVQRMDQDTLTVPLSGTDASPVWGFAPKARKQVEVVEEEESGLSVARPPAAGGAQRTNKVNV